MQHLEGSGTPVLYIGRTVLKGKDGELARLHTLEINPTSSVLEFIVHKQ
jgi:hypothetical protein